MFNLLLLLVGFSTALPAEDEVTSLPNAPPLQSKHYSGYMSASDTKKLHYYFVESEGTPTRDPVLIWFNGGPGCSSLDGFLYEHGPFRVEVTEEMGSPVAHLVPFEQAWSKLANTLYIEAPVGVGFSYSTAANPKSDYNCTDDTTAADNLAALKYFFSEKFPEYANHDLYITGESYAGVYVPTLAEAILKDKEWNEASASFPTLKGVAVGNGCSGHEVGICAFGGAESKVYVTKYLMSSGFLPESLKDSLHTDCDFDSWFKGNTPSKQCQADVNELDSYTEGLDTYCVYCDCPDDAVSGHSKIFGVNHILLGEDKVPMSPAHLGTTACINTYEASLYLNRPDVQEAMHVTAAKNSNWQVCGSAKGWDYTSTRPNLPRDTYPLLTSKIRVLVYNGDWDACVPYTDGQGWVNSLNKKVTKPWHPWMANGHVAGYATKYDVEGALEFVTVKGGRHEVPETEPEKAFVMISNFLNDQDF